MLRHYFGRNLSSIIVFPITETKNMFPQRWLCRPRSEFALHVQPTDL